MIDETSNIKKKQTHRALAYGETPEEAAQMLEFQHSLAIIIGINDYAGGIACLKTAANDAHRLAQILADDHQYEVELLVEDVTLDRLRNLLTEQLPARVGENDRVLFYFAGHGIALEGEDGPAGYLIPQDGRSNDRSTFLRMDELHDALMKLKCRHMLAILDCCFAGTIRWSTTRTLQWVPEVIHQERYERFIRYPAWQVITSAAYNQKALDILSGDVLGERGDTTGYLHSPFALALFEALSGAGDVMPRGQGDGVITASELYLYLRDYVEVKAEEVARHFQTPNLWPLKKHDKGEYIFLVPGYELNLPPAPELTYENNPYRGLQPFEEQHADLFFGRTALIEQLVEAVIKQPLTVVLGASGTGKSSLVQAGLLPALSDDNEGAATRPEGINEPAENGWFILPPMRLTESPLRQLESLLGSHLITVDWVVTLESLRADTQSLASVVTIWNQANPQKKLLLVVDQFEELITVCRDESEREQFIHLLATTLQTRPDSFRLVLTLRSDFEPQFANTHLESHWKDSRFVMPPMNQAELRQAIEGPASVRVLYFEPPNLVDKLINEVIQTPGALPLLSFTLSEIYIKYLQRRGDNRALTQADYEALGGVIGALRNRATEEYEKLDEAHRETMQRIMLRMVAIEGGELTRRRVPYSELVYSAEIENQRVETVLQRLLNARLIVSGENNDETYIEPAHDALVRAWDKLLVWSQEVEEVLPLQRRLTQAATDWTQATVNKQKDLLWHNDPRLPQVQETIEASSGCNGRNMTFLNRSWQVVFPTTKVFESQTWLNYQETEFVRQSVLQRGQNLRRLVGAVLAVIIILTGLTLFAFIQRNMAEERRIEAERQARIARANQLAAQSQSVPDKSGSLQLLLAREAVLTTWITDTEIIRSGFVTQEADTVLRNAIAAAPSLLMTLPRFYHSGAVQSVSFSPNGNMIVTASDDLAIRLWDIETGQEIRTFLGHSDSIRAVSFSPSGKMIASASADQSIRLWDVESGQGIAILTGHSDAVNSISFSPDGKTIVSAGFDHSVRLWDVETRQEIRSFVGHSDVVNSVSFSPNGKMIVTTGFDKTVRLWNVETGQKIRTFTGHTSSVWSGCFSPNSQIIATASADHTVRLWNIETGQEVRSFSEMLDEVNSVSFSPDGKLLVTATGGTGSIFETTENVVRIWDVETGQKIYTFKGHSDSVRSVTFSPDGKTVASASVDHTVRLWHIETGQEVRSFAGHSDVINSGRFSPDGRIVATASDDHTVRLWNVATGHEIRTLVGHSDDVNSVCFSPDGKMILTASLDKTVRLWNVETWQEIRTFVGHSENILSARFSPNGKMLVTASVDKTARLWNIETGEEIRAFTGHSDSVLAAEFSPDGKMIVTAGLDKTARLWDVASGQEIRTFVGHSDNINTASFNQAGTLIITASEDRTVRLWDVTTGKEVRLLIGHQDAVTSAEFSPDGGTIVTASDDETVRLWNVQTGQEVQVLGGHTSNVTSASFSPDGKMIVSTSFDQTARLWSSETIRESQILGEHSAPIHSIRFSPSGKLLLSASGDLITHDDQTARLWNVETSQLIRVFTGHKAPVNSVDFSPDEKLIVTTSGGFGGDNEVWLWDVETGQKVGSFVGHTSSVNAVRFSPDGKMLVTASSDGTISLWDVEQRKEIRAFKGANSSIFSIDISPNGLTIVSGSLLHEEPPRLWDVGTGQLIRELVGHSDSVSSASFSPNGKMIVTAGADQTARLWDVSTGQEIHTLVGHSKGVLSAAFSPDSRLVVTGSLDHSARVWDVETGQEIRLLTDHSAAVKSVGFSPDGQVIATASGDLISSSDNTIRLWPAGIEALLALAESLIQRNPPIFSPEERIFYRLD